MGPRGGGGRPRRDEGGEVWTEGGVCGQERQAHGGVRQGGTAIGSEREEVREQLAQRVRETDGEGEPSDVFEGLVDVGIVPVRLAGTEGGTAEEELQERGAEGVEIDGGEVGAREGFGGSVAGGAPYAGVSELERGEARARQPEVHDLHPAGPREQDVPGLQVAMHEVEGTPILRGRRRPRGFECERDLLGDEHGVRGFDTPVAQHGIQSDAVHELGLHDPASVVLQEVVHVQETGMLELPENGGLVRGASELPWIGLHVRPWHLQREPPARIPDAKGRDHDSGGTVSQNTFDLVETRRRGPPGGVIPNGEGMRIRSGRGFVMEPAKTGRSSCRRCRGRIAAGEPRFGVEDPFSSAVRWLHVRCAVDLHPFAVAELVERSEQEVPGQAAVLDKVRKVYDGALPDLVQLERDARNGRWPEVAEGLRAAWWSTRSPVLADLLRALDGDEEGAVGRGAAIRKVGRASKRVVVDELVRAARNPPDPRWVDLVLPWLVDPPFRSGPAFWEAVLTLLDQLADPRVLDAVRVEARRPVAELWTRFGRGAGEQVGRWLAVRASYGFPAVARPAHVLGDDELQTVDGIRTWIRRRNQRAEVAGSRVERLLHAVASGERAAYGVLADHWVERGDPRGELLLLERLGRRRTPEQRERRQELLRDWRSVVGDLALVAQRRGLKLEQGLVVGLSATAPRAQDVAAIMGSPDWATVRYLELRGGRQGRAPLGLVFAANARRLETVRVPDLQHFVALLVATEVQPSVHTVEIADWIVRTPPQGLPRTALPGLRCLRVDAREEVVHALSAALPGVRVDLSAPA